MKKILIEMTDFVLSKEVRIEVNGVNFLQSWKYANFLKQPLTLGMFVPCDEKGNVIFVYGGMPSKKKYDNLEKAKENVLFKGFVLDGDFNNFWKLNHESGNSILVNKNTNSTIESFLLKQPFEIELTESALK